MSGKELTALAIPLRQGGPASSSHHPTVARSRHRLLSRTSGRPRALGRLLLPVGLAHQRQHQPMNVLGRSRKCAAAGPRTDQGRSQCRDQTIAPVQAGRRVTARSLSSGSDCTRVPRLATGRTQPRRDAGPCFGADAEPPTSWAQCPLPTSTPAPVTPASRIAEQQRRGRRSRVSRSFRSRRQGGAEVDFSIARMRGLAAGKREWRVSSGRASNVNGSDSLPGDCSTCGWPSSRQRLPRRRTHRSRSRPSAARSH